MAPSRTMGSEEPANLPFAGCQRVTQAGRARARSWRSVAEAAAALTVARATIDAPAS
jgi:hypothetical protein